MISWVKAAGAIAPSAASVRMVQAMITCRVVVVSLALCWTVSVSAGQAQEAEKAFYAGKTVRMIVGSGPAGGYDIFSRLIAPYLARTLGTTVIVENQPGAGDSLRSIACTLRRPTVCKSPCPTARALPSHN